MSLLCSNTAVASQLTHDKDKAVTDAYKAFELLLLVSLTPPLGSLCSGHTGYLAAPCAQQASAFFRPFAHACLNILPQLSFGVAAHFPKFSAQMFPYLESLSSHQST